MEEDSRSSAAAESPESLACDGYLTVPDLSLWNTHYCEDLMYKSVDYLRTIISKHVPPSLIKLPERVGTLGFHESQPLGVSKHSNCYHASPSVISAV